MIDSILFQNSNLVWPVTLIALAVWAVFVWKEWSKPLKNRFYLTSLISLITVLSFVMLALKPLSENAVQKNTAVLLTNGFSENRLDSLKNKMKGIKSIDYQKNVPFVEALDAISSLFVLGDGVQSYDFWQFKNRSITYLGGDLPEGIVALKYTKESVLGEDLIVSGSYHKAKAKHRLVLQDRNGQGLDSIVLNLEQTQPFKLSIALKSPGRFVFDLLEKDSLGEKISSEPVAFKVVDRRKLKILLINGFPTFETKYLKNYLAEMGHEVVVRSQITRGRYKFEYFNTEKRPMYRLGEKELSNFDLLVIDATSFLNLSLANWSSIEKSVKNMGLGVFVQPEPNLFVSASERLGLKFERDKVTKASWSEFPKLTLEKFPFQFEAIHGLEEIHRDLKNHSTGYKRMEKGRVGTTLIQNTYQLQLNGKMEAYRRFWSELINRLSKQEELTTEWEIEDSFGLVNQPLDFKLRTAIEKPEVYTTHESQIALKQDVDMPSFWSGTIYPDRQGWNQIRLKTKFQDSLDFFVLDSIHWQTLRAKNVQKENERYFSGTIKEQNKTLSSAPIPSLWFFLLGLVGLGYLWVHPKLFKN